MKVTQEKLPASQIGLEVEIASDVSKKAYERALRDYTQNANIPGFRRGKVPRKVLIQRFGATRIKATVLEKLIQDSLEGAIKQEKIEILGNLQLRSAFEDLVKQFQPGEPITISASVDVPPEVTIDGYTGLTVQAEEVQFDPEKVDAILEDYRNRTATLIPIEDRPAQMGDAVQVDFQGVLAQAEEDGSEPTPVPGGSAEDFQLELEEGKFIPGFIDGIVGMALGETKEVSATFPENYPETSVAGKAAVFTVTVKELKAKELPDLDDDFAQDVSEFETLAELTESLESQLKEDAEQKTKTNIAAALFAKLVELAEVDPPEVMIDQETNFLVNQTAMQLQQQGLDVNKMLTKDLVGKLKEGARSEAIIKLTQRLAVQEVAKQQSITVSDETIDAKVNEFLEQYGDRDVDMGRLREVLEEEELQGKAVEWLTEHNTIDLVPEGTLTQEPPDDSDTESENVDAEAVDAETIDVEVVSTDVAEEADGEAEAE
ncbi:MAG: trigger factor [Symploca sp. SIO2B6]|nr:trigger factor [Symploca sp. SIO2B6]